jgi:tetratricopeptide (TPR) repeat protein
LNHQSLCATSPAGIESGDRCITRDELIKIQKNTLEANISFFKKLRWDYLEGSDESFQDYFEFELDWNYEAVAWQIRDDERIPIDGLDYPPSVFQRIVYMYAPGKPSIVILHPEVDDRHLWFGTANYDGDACFRGLKSRCGNKSTFESNYELTKCSEQSVTFEFRDYYESRLTVIIYNETSLLKEVSRVQELRAEQERIARERQEKISSLLNNGDSLYRINRFAEAQMRYTEANELENSLFVVSKIEACREAITDDIKSSGDSLYKLQDYAGAKRKYQEALSFHSKSKLSASLTESMRQCSIHILRNEAEAFYESNELKRALDRYNSLLELDKDDQNAKEKIAHIQNTIEFLKKRESVTYSYRETQKEDYNRLCRDLLTTINSGIDESLNGQLKGSIKIEFDTSGKNLSSIQNLHTSLNDALILGSLKGASLTPTKFFGYHAASKETIEISSDWNSTFSTLKFKKKGISANNQPSQTISTIQSFASKNEIYQGKCEVAIKSKNFNNSKYVDIDLIRYKAVGPEVALYSLVLPGLGSYKATAGRKGLLRFESFLLSAGIAVGAEMLSRNTYDEYLAANEPQKMNDLYNKANLYHKISLVAAGLTASIYVYELADAFHLGLKNTKRTKYVREQLKKKPISIQKQNIDKM